MHAGWLGVLTGLAVLAAPLYGRWYRRMRRVDDRALTATYPPPAPAEAWAGGMPELPPLGAGAASRPASTRKGASD